MDYFLVNRRFCDKLETKDNPAHMKLNRCNFINVLALMLYLFNILVSCNYYDTIKHKNTDIDGLREIFEIIFNVSQFTHTIVINWGLI